MAYSRRKGFKKSSFRRSWGKRRPIRKMPAFTSNKGTLVQLVASFNLPVVNCYFGSVVFPTHTPGVFYDNRAGPNARADALLYDSFPSINNALSVYQNVYISSVHISVTVPSVSPYTYQFIRNNIPLAVVVEGENTALYQLQVTRFANNVVDRSRLMVSSYGGSRGVTYKAKNKFDAVWLIKFANNQAGAGTSLNSTTQNLLSQQQIIFMANNISELPTPLGNIDGLLSFRVLYKCVVIGNNPQSQLPVD